RATGVDGSQVAHHGGGLVDQVAGEVVTLLDLSGGADGVVVVVERRDELMRLAAVKPVPAVETAPQRPTGPRRPQVGLVLRGEVPLANGVGGVALRAQDLGEEAVLPR